MVNFTRGELITGRMCYRRLVLYFISENVDLSIEKVGDSRGRRIQKVDEGKACTKWLLTFLQIAR